MTDHNDEQLPDSMFAQKLGQVTKHQNASDQLRLIRNVADNYRLSSKQAADFLLVFPFFDDMLKAAQCLFPRIYDPENFSNEIMPRLNYDEDRVGLGEALGIEVQGLKVEEPPPKEEVDGKFSGHAWMS